MRVTVDRDKCAGHAQCFAIAPDIYELDDDGYCIVDGVSVPSESESRVRDGASACPEMAITLDE